MLFVFPLSREVVLNVRVVHKTRVQSYFKGALFSDEFVSCISFCILIVTKRLIHMFNFRKCKPTN